MTGKLTTLAICLSCMVIFSDRVNAADHGAMKVSHETKTAFFQPRPGGVLDVITSPFRALTAPASYNRGYQQTSYQPQYGQSAYGRTNCVNGKCYPSSTYQSPCANGNCGIGSSCGANCRSGNCPGGNCGVNRYQRPVQYNTGYRGSYGSSAQQYPTYRPVSQPVYRSYRPVSQPVYQPYRSGPTSSTRNDPFFP
ncbi:hypothetical protein [uncultured Gimesia sp.]|uniref:hypothetical protein n=1 Tax=uncultured Gimesia sp. TaxID=1678688 RepID=UPI00261A356C|nr:hypothetical protein [uncultured Gimesia sp.]